MRGLFINFILQRDFWQTADAKMSEIIVQITNCTMLIIIMKVSNKKKLLMLLKFFFFLTKSGQFYNAI